MRNEHWGIPEAENLGELVGDENAVGYFDDHPEEAPAFTTEANSAPPAKAVTDIKPQAASGALAVDNSGLDQRVVAYQQKVAKLRLDQFEAAKEALKAQQAGPGLSERLYQLGAAFFAPPPTRGFAGMMANVAPTLARQRSATREGEDARAKELRALQEKYATGQVEDEGDVLSSTIKLEQLRAAMAKANKPKVQINSVTGATQVVPDYDSIAKPKSNAELASYSAGTPYVAWGGPLAGEILYKGDD